MGGSGQAKGFVDPSKVDIAWRDSCADLLTTLNKCRRMSGYLPWKCEHERHTFDACAHHVYEHRVEVMKEKRASGN